MSSAFTYDTISDKNNFIESYLISHYFIMFFFTCKLIYTHCKYTHMVKVILFR